MSVKRVSPDEAARLLEEGWALLDVRTIPEFEGGHPPGAYNVPLLHQTAQGRTANDDFVDVVTRTFAPDARLVVACRSGRRSLTACEQLMERGYSSVVDMQGGMAGETDAAGRVVCEGWEQRGHAVTRSPDPARTYQALKGASS